MIIGMNLQFTEPSKAQSPEVAQQLEELAERLQSIQQMQQKAQIKDWSCQMISAAATTFFWLNSTLRIEYSDQVKNGIYEIFSLTRVISELSNQGSPVSERLIDQYVQLPILLEPPIENVELAYATINAICNEQL